MVVTRGLKCASKHYDLICNRYESRRIPTRRTRSPFGQYLRALNGCKCVWLNRKVQNQIAVLIRWIWQCSVLTSFRTLRKLAVFLYYRPMERVDITLMIR